MYWLKITMHWLPRNCCTAYQSKFCSYNYIVSSSMLLWISPSYSPVTYSCKQNVWTSSVEVLSCEGESQNSGIVKILIYWYISSKRTSVIRISIIRTLGYPNAIMNVEIPKDSSIFCMTIVSRSQTFSIGRLSIRDYKRPFRKVWWTDRQHFVISHYLMLDYLVYLFWRT